MSVKTKLLSEEAVLTSKLKRAAIAPIASTQDMDEIALVSLKLKDPKKDPKQDPTTKTPDASKETAMFTKGKGGKGSPKGKGSSKGNRWTEPPWESNWGQAATGEEQNYRQWNPSPRSKGKGKGKHNADSGKAFNPQSLWCDIHQRYGHSTDWCFENPNRTGGPPPSNNGLWCETCNRSGHSADTCFAATIRIAPKGKGKTQPKGNTVPYGDRHWKS